MKKIKLLSIPTILVAASATMTLTQCGNTKDDPKTNKHTITYLVDTDECLKSARDTQQVDDGAEWSKVQSPVQYQPDVGSWVVNPSWVDPNTGEKISITYVKSDLTAKLKITNNTATEAPITYDQFTLWEGWDDPYYIPNDFFSSGTPVGKQMNILCDYTFKCTAPSTGFDYFWVMKYESTGPLVYLYRNNIVSITVGGQELNYGTDYIFEPWTGHVGNSIKFKNKIVSQEIIIKFRMLKDYTVVPAFQ